MTRAAGWLAGLCLAGALQALLPANALATTGTGGSLAALQASAHDWVQIGYDRPDPALAGLDALQRQFGDEPARAHLLDRARGLVLASAGRSPAALAVADRLQQRSAGDAALVRGANADTAGQGAESLAQAERALADYQQDCPADAPAPGCDPTAQWTAAHLLARQLLAQGKHDGANTHAAQAQRLARLDGSPWLLARMALLEADERMARGDRAGARQASEQGLALARRAASPRLEALLLANQAHALVQEGRPQDALRAVERALPVVRRHGERRAERMLLANAGLARIGLGQLSAARSTLEELLVALQQTGAGADAAQAMLLREFDDALAQAGELRGALALYHRERQLMAELMALNRETALAELRVRGNRDAQQRKLEQLERESALIGAQLDNSAAESRLWMGAAVVLGLGMLLAVLLVRSVRRVKVQLARNQDELRTQCERDPLTGLANRRALADRWQQGTTDSAGAPFTGGLLLVDIDHFKRINDTHGHAGGDAVLVEVARRLRSAVREQDLVVRWGGEEFLIHAPTLDAAGTRGLAERVLRVLGSSPVQLPAVDVAVTASLGFACFPLQPSGLPLTPDRAVNLTDMALYAAKNLGRHRGVGIRALHAADGQAMQAVEADFDSAWRQGHLELDELLPATPADQPAPDTPTTPKASAGPDATPQRSLHEPA
jgi:diguanylate cyclase (GGDEF)-like protein